MSNYTASSSTGLETANLQPSSQQPRTNEIEKAIESGNLRGKVEGEDKDKITVTEPTEGLRKYVEDNDSWIFTEKIEYTKQ